MRFRSVIYALTSASLAAAPAVSAREAVSVSGAAKAQPAMGTFTLAASLPGAGAVLGGLGGGAGAGIGIGAVALGVTGVGVALGVALKKSGTTCTTNSGSHSSVSPC